MKISVVGVGRVGLPLALLIASKGVYTYGIDINKTKIETLAQGKMPFLEPGAEEILAKTIGKTFHPTTDFSKIADSDALILTLGTPVDEFMNPDFSQLESALNSLLPNLKAGQTLILRSTVSPGSTKYVKNYIEKHSKLRLGENFYLAYCPERIVPGHAFKELVELPEIIGTLDDKSGAKARSVFNIFKQECYETPAINAELLKLFTNMYRYINFAIANEFFVIAEEFGGNVYEIVELSNKNYPRGGSKKPGFSAGPCLFKDGFFLTNTIPFPDLISTAWKINETLPAYLIQKLKLQGSLVGKKVALLGMAYKANIDDDRASLSHKIKKILRRELANVVTHDVFTDGDSFELALQDADIVIIATAHSQYVKNLDYYKKFVKPGCYFIDIWNIFKKESALFRI